MAAQACYKPNVFESLPYLRWSRGRATQKSCGEDSTLASPARSATSRLPLCSEPQGSRVCKQYPLSCLKSTNRSHFGPFGALAGKTNKCTKDVSCSGIVRVPLLTGNYNMSNWQKAEGHGSYTPALVGPQYNPYIDSYAHPIWTYYA